MRSTSVHFDFGGQVCLGKRLFENGFAVGRARVVIFRDGNEELRLGFRSLQVRTVWRISHDSAAGFNCWYPSCCCRFHALRVYTIGVRGTSQQNPVNTHKC